MSNKGRRPNIIVITTDQQRYDTLGVTGNELIRTPNLDALAARGVLFSHAYVQNPVCIPSRACLHTGRYIHQHGVQYMEEVIDTTPPLPPWEKTFMERLQESGYVTGAVGKIHMMRPKGYDEMVLTGGKGARWTQSEGLPIGPAPLHYVNPTYNGPTYKEWLEARHPGGYEKIYEQRRRPEYRENLTAIVNVLPEEEYVDYWIASQAVDFLKRRRDPQPFFLWIGFCGPHGPLDPPRRYTEMYPIEEMPLPKTYFADLSDKPEFLRRRRNRRFTEEDTTLIRRCIAHYYALITLIDDQIGRIWTTLEETGLVEDTILIFTSDHGDMLGDFGMMGKANFYEPVIRVPTILILPPRFKRRSPRFDGLVETMSLAPTVLDYAGIERPPEMTAKSWRPIVEDGTDGETAILCEYVSNDRRLKGKCVRTERYKFVSWGLGVGELYDLQEDPFELRNLYDDPEYIHLRDEMKDILLERLAESETPPYTQWLERLPEHVLPCNPR
jgi:arylsulfatase A-like enzyme